MDTKKTIPKHLTPEAKQIYASIRDEYGIDDTAGLRTLKVLCEAYDRSQKARRQIDTDGMAIKDKFGQLKPHPLLAIERDSRAAFLSGLKQLGLDLEPVGGVGRPHGSGKGASQIQEEFWN